MKGYNKIDNVCQHFANVSSEELIKKTCKYYPIFDAMFISDNSKYKYPKPRFDCVLEPYLILCDKKCKEYLDSKEKSKYLQNNEGNYQNFLEKIKKQTRFMKAHNILNISSTEGMMLGSVTSSISSYRSVRGLNIVTKQSVRNFDETVMEDILFPENFTSNDNRKIFDYMFLLNLSFYLQFDYMKRIKETLISFCIVKKYIINHSNEIFDDFDNSILKGNKTIDERKKERKRLKKELIELFEKIRIIKNKGKKLTKLYFDYMRFISKEMKEKVTKKYRYARIGYYLVNYQTFVEQMTGNDEQFINECFYN